MEFGFSLPSRGPMAMPEHIATLAHKGEEMGFGILAVSDHIIVPTRVQSTHPYSASGQFDVGGEAQGEYLEQLALLSFLAGITSSAKLLTAVLVLPHRPPVLTAKSLSPSMPHRSRRAVRSGTSISVPSGSYGRTTHRRSRARTVASRRSCSRPSRCSSRTRPSGWAVKARRRCAVRGAGPTPGKYLSKSNLIF